MSKLCYGCFKEYEESENQCPYCGHNNDIDREHYPMALPDGWLLNGRYRVGKVLGEGGFGITYLAQDYKTNELVAIKEYFPESMVTRNQTMTVRVTSGDKRDNFEYGKSLFLQEARTLAALKNNEHVVSIFEYFEENGTGTAYFAMEYVPGTDFYGYIKERGGRLSFDETMEVAQPVMDALTAIHKIGLVHRDVTPDNIRISDHGKVKLLDFGSARYSVGDVTKTLDVLLKHGFAPVEQYSRHGKQGAFTDVYSLSATIYYAITGKKPYDSVDRMDEDLLPLPSALGADISSSQEEALMHGLAVRAQDRFQTIEELRRALSPEPSPNTPPTFENELQTAADLIHKKKYKMALAILETIPDYRNAGELIALCKEKLKKKKIAIAVATVVASLSVGALAVLYAMFSLGRGKEEQHTPSTAVVENAVKATCTEAGSYDEVVYCSICGEELSRDTVIIPALEHQWGEWIEMKPATDVDDGEESRTCANDPSHIQTRIIPRLQHAHELTAIPSVSATCETQGNRAYYVCTGCGRFYLDAEAKQEIDELDTIIPALEHSWGAWMVVKAPTEESEGTETRTCENNASHVETRTISRLSHDLISVEKKAPTCDEAGHAAYYLCSNCGRMFSDVSGNHEIFDTDVVRPALGHDWGEWIITKEATRTVEGERVRTCRLDTSHTQVERIPVIASASLETPEQTTVRTLIEEIKRGDTESMKVLAGYYLEGSYLQVNPEEGVYWYLRAIEAGDKGAMERLAYCYETGLGIDQNLEMAEYWKARAIDD